MPSLHMSDAEIYYPSSLVYLSLKCVVIMDVGYEEVSSSSTSTQPQPRVNPFLVAFNCIRNVLWEVMDTMVDIVNGVFGFVDRKVFGDKDSDPTDVPFKACMVLTILVLALVVLKRNPTPL